MRAPKVVRESGLSWCDGPWQDQGLAKVDHGTLRHPRFSDVWAMGNVAGVSKGKTAASAKWQAPVVAEAIAADLAGRASPRRYGGSTSCPLITRVGRAMLVEFDNENDLVPSFPVLGE
jgi:sulfide:quinone oxidoreductase